MKASVVTAACLLLAGCSGSESASMAGKGDACCATDKPAAKADACCQAGASQQTISKEYLKPSESRTFAIEYIAKVSGIPAGTKKLRVWVPVPQDSTVQVIKNLSFSKEPKIATESKYGNK